MPRWQLTDAMMRLVLPSPSNPLAVRGVRLAYDTVAADYAAGATGSGGNDGITKDSGPATPVTAPSAKAPSSSQFGASE